MKIATSILVFCVAALLALGMVMLYSASMAQKGSYYLVMQAAWCSLGLVAFVITYSLDYSVWKKASLFLLVVSGILLALVFVPKIGLKINGAHRWLNFGPMRFQPSELAKVAVILALAHYAEYYQRQMGRFKYGVLIPGCALGLVLGLILAGRDYGTTMLLGSVCGVMLLMAGVKWRFFMPLILVVAIALGAAIWHNPVRRARVMAWVNPDQHMDTTGYQAWQAMIALGAGGTEGLGLGNSRQKLDFLPEHHTDFIFAIIGEELGIVATTGIVLTFVIVLVCGVLIASRARDAFGMYLAAGITLLICLQAFINIGVVTSVLPNKGLPLPFISYGGSNLLIMLASMGVLLSVARHGVESSEISDDPFAEASTVPLTRLS